MRLTIREIRALSWTEHKHKDESGYDSRDARTRGSRHHLLCLRYVDVTNGIELSTKPSQTREFEVFGQQLTAGGHVTLQNTGTSNRVEYLYVVRTAQAIRSASVQELVAE